MINKIIDMVLFLIATFSIFVYAGMVGIGAW